MRLTENEKRDAIKLIETGKPLPKKGKIAVELTGFSVFGFIVLILLYYTLSL